MTYNTTRVRRPAALLEPLRETRQQGIKVGLGLKGELAHAAYDDGRPVFRRFGGHFSRRVPKSSSVLILPARVRLDASQCPPAATGCLVGCGAFCSSASGRNIAFPRAQRR